MPEDVPVDLQALLKRFEKLESELTAALDELVATKAELVATKTELIAAKTELARKDQIIAALQQRLFGKSSERLDPDQLQFELDEAALGKCEPPPQTGGGSEVGSEEADDASATKRSRRKKADLFPENLPVIVREVIVPDEVAADPEAFVEIGEEHHDELEAVRAELYWNRQVRKKFVSKADRTRPPLMAPAPEPSVPGTLCGPQLMAQILVDKYEDHLPHYRQSKRFMRRYQVSLSRQTINGWTHAAAGHLGPIGEAIMAELREADILQIDESPGDYLAPGCGQTAQGYLWYYRDAERGTIYCDWQLGRGHHCLLEILGLDEASETAPFEGIIQCDGYSAYQALVNRYGEIDLHRAQ